MDWKEPRTVHHPSMGEPGPPVQTICGLILAEAPTCGSTDWEEVDCDRCREVAGKPAFKVCSICGGHRDQRDLVPCLVSGATVMAHWRCAKNANSMEREEEEGVPDEPWP